MAFEFFGTDSKNVTGENEEPSQAEIERQMAKLKEDSKRDVERQLAQQRMAARRGEVKEELKKAAEDVDRDITPDGVWKVARQKAETIIKDVRADVDNARRRLAAQRSADVNSSKL